MEPRLIPAWCHEPVRAPDPDARRLAHQRQAELTKPPGSLGRLETLAIELAALQGTTTPKADAVQITIFAADHGVAAEGVSAFPQSVTADMVRNFAAGGAAISTLARQHGALLEVVDVGTVSDPGPLGGVVRARAGAGTSNFCSARAQSAGELATALAAGYDAAARAEGAGVELFIGGEMGIANTTSAAAVACRLTGAAADELAGSGTGLDDAGVAHKSAVIERALARHADADTPFDALAALGGYEIAALSGAFVACGQRGIPVLVDGFIASVAALVAVRQAPELRPWLILSHRSAEAGHDRVLAALDIGEPLLDLGMRLGEGSGAAVALALVRSACALHNGMATFAEAGVADG